MVGTIRIEDMRLFAAVAEAESITAAASRLRVPKQTLSRRVAELERALGVHDDANREVFDAHAVPQGTLRVTADPVFGEAFLSDLLIEYSRAWPEVRIEVALTRRRVDLVEEGFDVAFRIGDVDDAALAGFKLGAATVRYCASPRYLAERGVPKVPRDLGRHDCLVVASEGALVRWPFRGGKGRTSVAVAGRWAVTSFAMARAAALAGLGIAIFPAFACADEIESGRLVSVLDDWVVGVGSVWLLHAAHRILSARVRAFADLARQRLARNPPWVVEPGARRDAKRTRRTSAGGADSRQPRRRRRRSANSATATGTKAAAPCAPDGDSDQSVVSSST
jgi:DNA-binding transcriptional LysR family regulator